MYQARSQTREEVPTRPDPPGLPGRTTGRMFTRRRSGFPQGLPPRESLPPLMLAFTSSGMCAITGAEATAAHDGCVREALAGQAIAPPVRCSCGAVGCRSERFWAVAQRSSFALSSGTASRCGTSPSRCRRFHGSRCRRWSSARTRRGARRRPRPRSRRPPCPPPPPCRQAPAPPRAR